MSPRKRHLERCTRLLHQSPCLALLGARQVDKTTLAGEIVRGWSGPVHQFDFIRTFVERDLPTLGSRVPSTTTDRFWRMLAHVHGQVWNASRIASSFGVADSTVRRYLDTLTSTLVVDQLQPWHENVGKRQVKSPKAYINDSGLLYALLDLNDRTALERHPVVGASWEGFIIRQLIEITGARRDQRYFWATHAGAELDLLIVRGDERIGFEVKRTATPKVTASIRSAIETLRLDRAVIVHAGQHTFPLADGIEARAARSLLGDPDGSQQLAHGRWT
ncbi:MAG: ATP-binding protein [Acidimicrobiales bacterium]